MSVHRQGSSRRLTSRGRLACAVAVLALLGACQQPNATLAPVTPSMRIGADSASAPVAESLLNVYEAQLASSLLTLETGSREVILAELASGELDAALIFYSLDGQDLFATPIGYTPLAVVIPADTQVSTLTREELREIFSGHIVSWSEVGGPDLPIQVIAGVKGTSERLAFDSLVMGEYPVTSAARLAMDGQSAIGQVSTTRGAISYGVLSPLPEHTLSVKIDGIPATLAEVQNRRYALESAVVFASQKEPDGQLRAFLDWILSDSGQEVVRRHMVGLDD